ncbi:MAG TPA: hypothetical protein VGI39_28830 [Polyangiaceae bacterium]|jgi:hypothetical protein
MPSRDEPKTSATQTRALVDLDDPLEGEASEEFDDADRPPDTARPCFDTNEFAHHVESAGDRMTEPPSPTYDMLRDSCKTGIADELPLDEERIVRPSSRRRLETG